MLVEFLRFVWAILSDQRGEETAEEVEAREAQEKTDAEAKEKEEAEAKTKEEEEAAAALKEKEGKPENKYEGFFDHEPTVDEVFAKLKEVDGDHQVLTGKTTKTEQHLSAVRKTLGEAGINVFFDEEGNVRLGTEGKNVVEKKTVEKKRRFTDDNRKTFGGYFEGEDQGKGFLDALTLHVQDVFDDMLDETRVNAASEKKAHDQYMSTRMESAQKIIKLFPTLISKSKDGKDNPKFDEKFHKLALEIYEREYCTKGEDGKLIENHPNGQLWGALEASSELNIAPTSIAEAKAAGVLQGKEEKTVLGRVGRGAGAGQEGKLSQEEYLKLTPEGRVDYDKKQMGI